MTLLFDIKKGKDGLAEASALRHRVFVGEQAVPEEIEQDEHDLTADHILAHDQGRLVGTGRLFTVGSGEQAYGKIGRMAVDPACRGQGIGRQMLDRLVALAREQGLTRVVLDAQCHAQRFYEQAGFTVASPVFQEAGIDHVRMECTLTV